MSSVDDVKRQVAAVVAETEQAAIAMRGAAERMAEALSRLRLTAVGTVHPSLTEAIGRLEQAAARLDEAEILARGAVESANIYRTVA